MVSCADWLFGIMPGLTYRGVRLLARWLDINAVLKISVVIVVYPACGVSRPDLGELRGLVGLYPDRLSARILPVEQVTGQSINAFCFSSQGSDVVTMVVGPTEDVGIGPWRDGQLNLVFQAGPSLVESFKGYFDWVWGTACDVSLHGAIDIPDLVLPEGSQDAALLWQSYQNRVRSAQAEAEDVAINGDHQGVLPLAEAPSEPPTEELPQSPTDRIGVKGLDPLADFMSRLYEKGSLVSIDKLSKIPPLDTPVDPSLFGDASELRSGSVTRKVNMRVSVIDEDTLKEIDKRKNALRTLLTKFTFGLADNMRWMPNAARTLFEAELKRANDDGLNLIKDLLKGNVDAFLAGKRDKLEADLNGIYSQLGRPGRVTPEVIEKVTASLKVRLTKAQSSNFLPK